MSKPQQPIPFQLPQTHGVVLKVPPQAPPRNFKTVPSNNANNNIVPSITNNIPPPVNINTQTPPVGPKPMVNKVSPNPSPSSSPGLPRRPPPTPQSQQQQLNNLPPPITTNIPPPITQQQQVNNLPPPLSVNTSNNNLPPPLINLPPPIATSTSTTPPTPPSPMLNKQSPQSTPTTPKRPPNNVFKPVATNNVINSPQAITMLGSPLSSVPNLRTLSQPPAFVKSNSLDPKTMSSFTPPPPPSQSPLSTSGSLSSSGGIPNIHHHSNNTSPNLSSNTLMPPPPAFLSGSNEKRNSVGNQNIGNPRLSQDLNSLFQNRLTNGLSPPVSTPFYDEKILSSASKSAELKDKRDIEERERKDRERLKKEKEEQEKKDKKDKKEKSEQDKKDQEKKKKEEAEKKKKEDQEKKDKEKKKKDDAKKSTKLKGSGSVTPPTIFNSTLDQIMEVQRERADYPDLPYPAFLRIITEGIIQYNGCGTEGIFRVPGLASEVNRLKKQINEFDFTLTSDDPHVLAGLLKLWLRELSDPVIPTDSYYDCIKSKTKEDVTRQFNQLPQLNREVLFYLLNFLKTIANPANTPKTKMDTDNIAMVFAPGLLRCPSNDPNFMLNTQFEKDFIKNLIDYIV